MGQIPAWWSGSTFYFGTSNVCAVVVDDGSTFPEVLSALLYGAQMPEDFHFSSDADQERFEEAKGELPWFRHTWAALTDAQRVAVADLASAGAQNWSRGRPTPELSEALRDAGAPGIEVEWTSGPDSHQDVLPTAFLRWVHAGPPR